MSKHDWEEIPVLEPVTVKTATPKTEEELFGPPINPQESRYKGVAIEGGDSHNNVPINADRLLDMVYEGYLENGNCYPIPTTRGEAVRHFEACIRTLVADYWEKTNEQSRDEAALHGE